MTNVSVPERHLDRAQAIADRFAALPEVTAVALGGSVTAGLGDECSDLDIYVYAAASIPADIRTAIAHEFAGADAPGTEICKPFWGDEDAWIDRASGLRVDLMYWSPAWIEAHLDRCLETHQARMGYTTGFWYTVQRSRPLFDRDGWFARLKARADLPYPDALRRAIVELNYPALRQIGSSYVRQIERAVHRRDRVSLNHRVAALLASYFDILFAVNGVTSPGEKRLVAQARRLCTTLPADMAEHVDALIGCLARPWDDQPILAILDRMLDNLDGLLEVEELLPA